MSHNELLPTIAYTSDFLNMLSMTDKAAYALKPVFACRVERMSTKGAWLPRAIVFGQQGILYLIDPGSKGRVTHEVNFGVDRRKKINLDIEVKADPKDSTQCVRLVCEKPKTKDPEVILLRFHCSRGPLALQFAFVVKHFSKTESIDPALKITITGADKSLVAATKPVRSSSNPRSSMNALQKMISSRGELVTIAEKEKQRLEKEKQAIVVPAPKAVPPIEPTGAQHVSTPLAAPVLSPPQAQPLLTLPEAKEEEQEQEQGGTPDGVPTSSSQEILPAQDEGSRKTLTKEELRAAQELDLLEVRMQCDTIEAQIRTVQQQLADEEAATRAMEEEFALQIGARRAELRTAPEVVRILDDNVDDSEESDWEATATRDLEKLKDDLREVTARRNELLSNRQSLERALEGAEFSVLGLDDDDGREAEEEIAILMAELRVAQSELEEEQQETLMQKLAAESEVEAAFRKAILLQHDRLRQLQEQYHGLRSEFVSPSEEAERIAACKVMDDPSPIAYDPTYRPRTVRELKTLIQADLMRL